MRTYLFEIDSKYKPIMTDLINTTLDTINNNEQDKINLLKKLLEEINSSADVPLPTEIDFT